MSTRSGKDYFVRHSGSISGGSFVIGGWHDFRHTLSRTRRAGLHPVVIKGTLHPSKVDLAMNRYDKGSAADIREGLKVVSQKLLASDSLSQNLLPTAPKQSEGNESAP